MFVCWGKLNREVCQSSSETMWRSDWWNTWPKAVLNLNCHTLLWHGLRHAISVGQHSEHIHSFVHFKSISSTAKKFIKLVYQKKKKSMLVTYTIPFPLFRPTLSTKQHYNTLLRTSLILVTYSTVSYTITASFLWHCRCLWLRFIDLKILSLGVMMRFCSLGAQLVLFWPKKTPNFLASHSYDAHQSHVKSLLHATHDFNIHVFCYCKQMTF